MGHKTEFETRNWRKLETRRDEKHNFSMKNKKKQEQQAKKHQNTGLKKPRKLQEIQKQDFDEITENAENGNNILTRFREMLKTETRTITRSSQMSQYDDSRAKTRSCCRPKPN